jgi:hypothetical protein
MANKNFVVHNGLTVGALTIDAATGDINTSGNVNISGSVGVSQITKNDSSISINDTGSGSTVYIVVDGTTEHTVDADGVSLAAGNRYAINGTSVLNATTLGAAVVNSSLTTVGNLTSLSVAGAATVFGNLTVQGLTTLNGGTLTLGDTDTDNVVFGADINSSIIPNTDATYHLGSSGQKWANVFATNLTGTIQTASQTNITTVGNLTSLSVAGDATVQGNLTVHGLSTLNGGTLTLGDSNTDNVVFGADVNSNVIPNTDSTYQLGSADQKWAEVYATNLTGNIQTASQTAITAVGTLTALAVTGNVTVGSGSAAGVVTSKGSYDLTLTTNDTGANAPKITLVQSDDGNIELNPSGIGVVTALSHLYVGDGSTAANISSFGAYNLVLSTNRDLGRATITLSASTDGNIDFNLNGTGTINAPEITFGGGGTQTKAAIVAGSDSYIQYNNGNDFGGSANLTFNDTTNQITVGGAIVATTDDATALAIALG